MPTSSKRIGSLDALRAIMMLLGIVLHASESYSVAGDHFWPKDPYTTSLFFNYLSSFIHIFRMPIFFMISGFFGAMLFYRRGVKPMVIQRAKRIVLPFAVFLLLLHPIIYYAYDTLVNAFEWKHSIVGTFSWLPTIPYHLWFLYYLIWITFFTVGLALLLQRNEGFRKVIGNAFLWLFQRQWLFLLSLSILLFVLLVWMWDYWVSTPLTFQPNVKIFVFYLVFYLIGWLLFVRQESLKIIKRYGVAYALIGFLAYTIKFILRDHFGDVAYGGLNTIIGCFLILGITGVFLSFFEHNSKNWRYLSDASYWVYLIHLPLTIFIPAAIVNWPIPSGLKFFFVVSFSSVISFFTYHYLVRWTVVGMFLNGRKYALNRKVLLRFISGNP